MRIIQKRARAAGGMGVVLALVGTLGAGAQEVPVYKNVEAPPVPLAQLEQPAAEAAEAAEAATSGATATAVETNAPAVVRPPGLPEDLNVSPGLGEIIRLVQSGVGEDVLLAYVKNSTNVYFLGSEQIVYLNDLGVSAELLKALIERDNTPEALAHKGRAGAASPLPPGVALNTPATNIYLAQPAAEATLAPGEEQPVEPVPAVEAGYGATVETAEAPNTSVNYFYDALAPYGSWVNVDGYGLCWQPTVAVVNTHWRPYADNGRWLWSSSGWYWYSDYSWGWAPFHYGRWFRSPACGWVWYPGSVWGPSWVTWRYNDGYCGWAPLPPYTYYSAGVGLVYRSDSVHFSFGFGFGYYDYVFLPWGRFCDYYPYHHYVHGHHASVIYKSSRPVNHFERGRDGVVNRGFGREVAARRTGRSLDEVVVRPEQRPVITAGDRPERLIREGRSLAIARPQLPDSPDPRSTGAGAGRPGRGSGAGVFDGVGREAGADLSRPGRSPAPAGSTAPALGSSARTGGPVIRPQTAQPGAATSRTPAARPGRTVGAGAGQEPGTAQTVRPGGPVIRSGAARPSRSTTTPNISGTVTRSPFEPIGRSPRSTTPSTSAARPSTSVSRPAAPVIRRQTPAARPQTSIARPQTPAARVFTPPPSSSAGRMTRSVPVFPGIQSSTPRPSTSVSRPPASPGVSVPRVSRPAAPSVGRSAPSSVITRPSRPPAGGGVAPRNSAPSRGAPAGRPSRPSGGRGN